VYTGGIEMTSSEPTVPRPAMPPRAWAVRVARVITELTAPAVLAGALLVVVALDTATSGTAGIVWGLLAALFAVAVPFAFILSGARRGVWSTHHVNERERRPFVLTVALGSLLVGLMVLASWNAPRELLALVVAMGAGLALVLAVSRVWKVSIHAAVAGGTTVVLALLFGPVLLAFGLVALAAAWSRTVLDDHTVAQVVVGLCLGAAAAALVFGTLR
jgi:membrane-associated phospholipid phosphatase